jgi:hypothetical protein
MSELVSLRVRALFSDMGIDCENMGTKLVIERFEQGREGVAAVDGPIRSCYCRLDVLEAA